MCKNIPAKFRESLSKCSAAHPKIALSHNISVRHSRNLAGMFLHYSVHKLCPTVHTFASSPQVSATHQRLVLELSDLHAESTDCGEDEQGSATASNGGVSTVGGGGGRGTFDPDFVRHGSGMIFSTLQTCQSFKFSCITGRSVFLSTWGPTGFYTGNGSILLYAV